MVLLRKIGIVLLVLNYLFLPGISVAKIDSEIENGIKLFEKQNFDKAKEVFEKIANDKSDNPTAFAYLGRIFLIQGDYDKSIKWLKKAVKLDEYNSRYHFHLGQAYGVKAQRASIFKKPGAANKVKKEFEKAVELDPKNIEARFGLMQFYLMAPGIMGGDKDKAKEQASEIKKIDVMQGHRAFGLLYSIEKKYDEVEKEYLAAIKKEPDDLSFSYRLGNLYIKMEKYDQAFAIYESILKNHPEEIKVCFSISRLALVSGKNLDIAEESLKKYIESESNENINSIVWAYYRLGNIYEKIGKKEKAKFEYETALKLKPDFKNAEKALKKLKQ